jgi:hypothetical protein
MFQFEAERLRDDGPQSGVNLIKTFLFVTFVAAK